MRTKTATDDEGIKDDVSNRCRTSSAEARKVHDGNDGKIFFGYTTASEEDDEEDKSRALRRP